MKTDTARLLRCGACALLLLSAPLAAGAAETHNREDGAVAPAANSHPLAWTEWELTAPTYPGLKKPPVLRFTDTRLNATVGLNGMSGAYTLQGKDIGVEPLISTRMAGPQPLMEAEDRYGKALQSARSFEIASDGKKLTLRGEQTLTFRLTGRAAQGFEPAETKIINVAPQLGPQFDGDKTPKYLQLEDLSQGVSWGFFTEEKIEGFRFEPGYQYQLRTVVERNARTGEKRLRLQEIFSQQWTRAVTLLKDQTILDVAPTAVECGAAAKPCLQVREEGGEWKTLREPVAGFDYQDGWRYRLQVDVTRSKNSPANDANARYKLVRLLDKTPVTF